MPHGTITHPGMYTATGLSSPNDTKWFLFMAGTAALNPRTLDRLDDRGGRLEEDVRTRRPVEPLESKEPSFQLCPDQALLLLHLRKDALILCGTSRQIRQDLFDGSVRHVLVDGIPCLPCQHIPKPGCCHSSRYHCLSKADVRNSESENTT